MKLEHPSGSFEILMQIGGTKEAPVVERVGLVRTARALMDGAVRVPAELGKFLPISRSKSNDNKSGERLNNER
jgi:hypothetical protein